MQNGTMFQAFHWYIPADGSLWTTIKNEAKHFFDLGITGLWLPPAYKGADGSVSQGYDVYDIYDLGEFDQKGSVRTKYGTRQEYLDAISALHELGIQVYVDVVTNHLSGADETEKIVVRKVDPENRNEFISEPLEIEAFTKFTFPGRKKKYSDFVWDHRCFTGVDYASNTNEKAVFSILNEYGEGWEEMIHTEKGNFDYLMGADIEYRNEAVREELKRWGEWYLNLVKFDGVRLDAVKHITPSFLNDWIAHMSTISGSEFFAVGEYWAPDDRDLILKFIEATNGKMSLFDAPLHHNFFKASRSGRDYDLCNIFKGSLLEAKPFLAVTIVDNHDTQPLQALEAPVDHWFKPIAYALILLREQGYPCVFYPDLYGADYTDKNKEGEDCDIHLAPVENLDKLLKGRKFFAYGTQRDYFDHPNCIGWTREGNDEQKTSGCAVIISNGDEGVKDMEMGKTNAGVIYIDYLGKRNEEVTINEEGWGKFFCEGGSVSVWVKKNEYQSHNKLK